MRLPLVRHIVKFAQNNDVDFLTESLDLLDDLIDARGIKDEELDVIGELMSNILGAKEVFEDIKSGMDEKEALNKYGSSTSGASLGDILGSVLKK